MTSLVQFGQTTVSAVSDDPRIRKIDEVLSGLEKEGLDGVIIIRSRDRTLLHKAYGFADRDSNRKMLVSTGFDIGSIVKPITFAGILRLEEEGKLATTDTIGKFFPTAPEDKKAITIAQVQAHTAGLPDVFGGDYELASRDWLVDKVLNAKLLGPPGEKRRYSNSGYSLLAAIIEKVSGKPYETYIRDEVLTPAGITDIGYVLAGWKNENLAVGYYEGNRWGTPLDKKWAADGPSWNLRGNGGMLSTAADLSAWFERLFEGKVLKPATLAKYLSNATGTSRTLGVRIAGPAGGNGVFNSFQLSVVDSDFHLTFFTSNSKQQAEAIFPKIRDDIMALAREAIEQNKK
jgi:CubicO group peptidase (beta-lactamase class C family)